MASKKDLKEIVSRYISENYSKKEIKEVSKDFYVWGHKKGESRSDEKLLFTKASNLEQAQKASKVLKDKHDMVVTRIGDSDLEGDGSEVIDMFKKSVNDLDESAFGSSQEEFRYLRKEIGDSQLLDDIESINVNDLESLLDALTFVRSSVQEMSTTAGAPSPATKYAFKRKK